MDNLLFAMWLPAENQRGCHGYPAVLRLLQSVQFALDRVSSLRRNQCPVWRGIRTLTDSFCTSHLDDEYRQVVRQAVGALARKRPSPLLKGKENVWAAATIHAVGRVNFLDDPSQTPHCKSRTIFEFFGIGESTGQNKSKEIREILKMGPLSPEWTLPSRLADNPMIWMLEVNGMIVDIRQMPIELQRFAYEEGLIPFVPDERQDST